jgi:hypothetical protein
MNVTLSIDDEVLSRAQELAARRGTSVDQLIRDYLQNFTSKPSAEETIAGLEELWHTSPGDSSGRTWNREDCMSVPTFVDTNVLVYADDRANPSKRDRRQ